MPVCTTCPSGGGAGGHNSVRGRHDFRLGQPGFCFLQKRPRGGELRCGGFDECFPLLNRLLASDATGDRMGSFLVGQRIGKAGLGLGDGRPILVDLRQDKTSIEARQDLAFSTLSPSSARISTIASPSASELIGISRHAATVPVPTIALSIWLTRTVSTVTVSTSRRSSPRSAA